MRRNLTVLNWSLLPVGGILLLLLSLALVRLRPEPPGGFETSGSLIPPVAHPAAAQTRELFGWPGAVAWRDRIDTSRSVSLPARLTET